MPTEQTETLERLAFEGPLSLWQVVFVGAVLLALAFWSVFRVPERARRKSAPLLWLLRIAAVAILLWMLLGPVNVTLDRHLTPKSIAIVTDVSGSMDSSDPPEKTSDLRWRAVHDTDAGSTLINACDRAVVAAATARNQLGAIVDNATGPSTREQTRRELVMARQAITSAVQLIETVRDLLKENTSAYGAELSARAEDVLSGLPGSGFNQIESFADRSASSSPLLDPSEISQLADWQNQLARSDRRLRRLAETIAGQVAANGSGAGGRASVSSESLTRREKVNRLLEAGETTWIADHEQTARIRQYTFDRETVVVTPDAGATKDIEHPDRGASSSSSRLPAPFTNLSSVLERINRDAGQEEIQAVVLISDGRHNDPEAQDPRNVATLLDGIPVHAVSVGNSQLLQDLVLHHVDAPSTIVEHDQLVVEGIVSAFDCEGQTCLVELREGDQLVDSEEIEIASIRRDFHIRLTGTPKSLGRHDYTLSVSALEGEVVPDNNSTSFNVDVIDATLRILVADDFPRWEFRYLVNLFERAEQIEYEQLLFHPNHVGTGELKAQRQFPRDVDGWSRYRVVILGDLSPDQLGVESQRALAEYVTARGGTVILIAGTNAMPHAFVGMPLDDLAPVVASNSHVASRGYRLELSAEGELAPAMQLAEQPGQTNRIWQEMSRSLPVYSLSHYCSPKPAARTLIHALHASGTGADETENAFLCWQMVGRGRIVYLAAPTAYQLRMKHGDRYHHRFWGQLVRWAVARDLGQGSKTVQLSTDRSRVAAGENLQVVANMKTVDGRPILQANVRVEALIDETSVALIDMSPDENIPGRYLAEFTPADDGTMTLRAFGTDVTQLLQSEDFTGHVETSVVVDPLQSTETEDTRADTALLRQITQLTGGQLIAPNAVEQIVALTDLEPRIDEQTVRGPLWNDWRLLWLFLGCLTLEWSIRKSTGLP